jgi:hypothetical protein
MTSGGTTRTGRRRRSRTAISVLGLTVLGFAAFAGTAALTKSGRLPAAFADSDSGNVLSYPYAKVGDTLWIGLPVMPMRLHEQIRITAVRVNGQVDGASMQFYDMTLSGANQGRHVALLQDRSFRDEGFHLGRDLIGTVFATGAPTHYGIVRMTLTRPGNYEIKSVTLAYKSSSGASGSQTVAQSIHIAMCGEHCPPQGT